MRKAEDGWKKRFGKPKSFRKERKKETRSSLGGDGEKTFVSNSCESGCYYGL